MEEFNVCLLDRSVLSRAYFFLFKLTIEKSEQYKERFPEFMISALNNYFIAADQFFQSCSNF